MEQFLGRFAVRTKVLGLVGVVCALLALAIGVAMARMGQLNDATKQVRATEQFSDLVHQASPSRTSTPSTAC
jgi:hypothetical protein